MGSVSHPKREPVPITVDENFARYYQEVGKVEMIDAATERKLFRLYKRHKNIAARDRIIGNCLRFVIKLARRYTRDMDTLKDLIAAGNEGLLFALDRYDPKRNTRFLSYATHYILLYIRNEVHSAGLVAMPLWRQKTIRKVQQARNKVAVSKGCHAAEETICKEVDISHTQLEKLRIEKFRYTSVERVGGAVDGSEQCAIDSQTKDKLGRLLLGLGSKERFVLRAYFGLVSDPMSLRQIANVLGVSSERVRQIREEALARMRRGMSRKLHITTANDLVAEDTDPAIAVSM